MELDGFHVDQVAPGPKGEGVAVTGGLPRVGGVHPALPDSAGGHHHRLGREHHELTGRASVADQTGNRALGVVEQAEHLDLHEDVDAVGDRLLLECADELEPGPIADVGQSGETMPSEVALEDQSLFGPIEQRPPLFEFADPIGRFLGVELGHAPVVEHLAPAHGVPEMHLPAVIGVDVPQCCSHATFGHHRVGLAQQRLADQGGAQPHRPRLDRRSQSCSSRADDDDVEVVGLVLSHVLRTP